jgi:hypothetical protein
MIGGLRGCECLGFFWRMPPETLLEILKGSPYTG